MRKESINISIQSIVSLFIPISHQFSVSQKINQTFIVHTKRMTNPIKAISNTELQKIINKKININDHIPSIRLFYFNLMNLSLVEKYVIKDKKPINK